MFTIRSPDGRPTRPASELPSFSMWNRRSGVGEDMLLGVLGIALIVIGALIG